MRIFRLLKNDIAKESVGWVADGIISESQAERICTRYGVDYHLAQSSSFGYKVLLGLGYLFIGLALIVLLGANWEQIPRAGRMLGLIALTMGIHGIALKKLLSGERSSSIYLFFFGNMLYGASIILIAQIYHLGEHMPDGVFWWALGCLPVGILLNSPLVATQAGVLALIWFFIESSMGFYPALFPVFIIGSVVVLCRGKQSIPLFLITSFSAVLWGEYSLAKILSHGLSSDSFSFAFTEELVPVSAGLLILIHVLSTLLSGHVKPAFKNYAVILKTWSIRLGLVFMFLMSFNEGWVELLRSDWEQQALMLIIFAIIMATSLLVARASGKPGPTASMVAYVTVILAITLIIKDRDYATHFQVVHNVALISSGAWLVLKGIHEGVSEHYFLGLIAIFLTAFVRYIDLIGDYIGGATLFLVFAALLIGAAKYWKKTQSERSAA